MKKKRLLAALLAVSLSINMMPEYIKASEAEHVSAGTAPVLATEEAVVEVSEEIEKLYEDTDLEKAAESEFGTCNLIVSAEDNEQEPDFDTFGAEQTVSIGGGLYLIPDKRTAEAAWKKFQGMEGILFAEPDAVLESEDVPESGTQKEEGSSDVPESGTHGETTPGEITAGEAEKPVLIAVLDTGADMDDALLAPYLVTTAQGLQDFWCVPLWHRDWKAAGCSSFRSRQRMKKDGARYHGCILPSAPPSMRAQIWSTFQWERRTAPAPHCLHRRQRRQRKPVLSLSRLPAMTVRMSWEAHLPGSEAW